MTTTTSAVDWRGRARDLAAKLTTDGVITEPAWREAFEQTTPACLRAALLGTG